MSTVLAAESGPISSLPFSCFASYTSSSWRFPVKREAAKVSFIRLQLVLSDSAAANTIAKKY